MSAIEWITYVIAYTRRMSLLTRADVWHVSVLTRANVILAFCIFFLNNFFISGYLANFY